MGAIGGAIAGAAIGAVVGGIVGGVAMGIYYDQTGRNFGHGFKVGAITGAIAGGMSGFARGNEAGIRNDLLRNRLVGTQPLIPYQSGPVREHCLEFPADCKLIPGTKKYKIIQEGGELKGWPALKQKLYKMFGRDPSLPPGRMPMRNYGSGITG